MKTLFALVVVMMMFGAEAFAQDAPSGYTTMGLRKWSSGARPSADSLNANWTLTDSLIRGTSERPLFTSSIYDTGVSNAHVPTLGFTHRDPTGQGTFYKKMNTVWMKRHTDVSAVASFQYEAVLGGVGDTVAVRIVVGSETKTIYIPFGTASLTDTTLSFDVSGLTNNARYGAALWLASKGDTVRVQNLYIGVRAE